MSGTGCSIDDDSKFGITALIRIFFIYTNKSVANYYHLLLLSGKVIGDVNTGGRGFCFVSGEISEFVEIFVSGMGIYHFGSYHYSLKIT